MYHDIYHPQGNQENLKKASEGLSAAKEGISRVNELNTEKLLERQRGMEDIFGRSDEFGLRSDGSYGVPYQYAKDYNMSTDGVNMLGFEQENDENR